MLVPVCANNERANKREGGDRETQIAECTYNIIRAQSCTLLITLFIVRAVKDIRPDVIIITSEKELRDR